LTENARGKVPQEEAQKAGNQMSKFRTTLASALVIASLLAGGVATHAYAAPRPAAHHLADEGCCDDQGSAQV
jgi:hypothetical protein